jgi:signal transduction histidine kinase
VLVLLQPFGPGTVIGFVTVGMAASRLSRRAGLGVLAGAVAVFGVAGARQPSAPALVTEVGLVACYTVMRLAWRVREGQERAERLLLELDANREAQAQAVVIAERQQLAREMHDVLAHSLSGLVLQLEGARLLAAQTPEQTELGAAVERAHHLAKAGLDEARRAIGMLRDDALPGPERLPALASGFERDTGVPCTMRVTGPARELAPDARLAVYRVAQEALTNIRRHAAAERVELQLAYDASEVRLAVQDHGAMPSPVVESDGYGLAGMRERADLIGGSLSAAPTETGFCVELRIPA